jgi:hypothetical protein
MNTIRTPRLGPQTLSVIAAVAVSLPLLDIIWSTQHAAATTGTVAAVRCSSSAVIIDKSRLAIIDSVPRCL